MYEILDTFSVPSLIKSVFHPFIALHSEIDAILMNKHKTRSTFKIVITIIISLIGIYLFYNNQTINQFFIKITEAFNFATTSQSLVSACLAIITSCHIGDYISNVLVRSFCKCRFGDPDFYVTKKRAIKLEQQFREQGNEHITQQQIIEVVEFCRKNLRRKSSNELGTKPEDWKKTLESLLYEADIEHFLDQRQALKIKRLEIQKKREAILARSSSLESTDSQQDPQTAPQTSSRSRQRHRHESIQSSATVLSPTRSTANTTFDYSFGSTETTPLLYSPTVRHFSYSQSQSEITKEELALQTLNRFKHHHLKKEKHSIPPSDAQLTHHCQCHLQHKELETAKRIYPERLTHRLSFFSLHNKSATQKTPLEESTDEETPTTGSKTELRYQP